MDCRVIDTHSESSRSGCFGSTFDYELVSKRTHPQQFSQLKQLAIYAGGGEDPWPLGFFQEFLLNKELSTLRAFGASGAWDEVRIQGFFIHVPITLSPRSTTVTRLELVRCTFSKEDIEVLISACTSLRALSFSAGGTIFGPTNFTVPELIDALQPHQDTLEELALSMWLH